MAQARRRSQSELNATFFYLVKKTLYWIIVITMSLPGLWMLVALATYYPEDPSWAHAIPMQAVINNWAGLYGAYFADIGFYFLGSAAWLLPITSLGYIAALAQPSRLQQVDAEIVLMRALGMVISIIAASGFLALYNQQGGVIGEWLGNKLILPVFFWLSSMDQQQLGAQLVTLGILILSLILATGLTPLQWIDAMGAGCLRCYGWVTAHRQAITTDPQEADNSQLSSIAHLLEEDNGAVATPDLPLEKKNNFWQRLWSYYFGSSSTVQREQPTAQSVSNILDIMDAPLTTVAETQKITPIYHKSPSVEPFATPQEEDLISSVITSKTKQRIEPASFREPIFSLPEDNDPIATSEPSLGMLFEAPPIKSHVNVASVTSYVDTPYVETVKADELPTLNVLNNESVDHFSHYQQQFQADWMTDHNNQPNELDKTAANIFSLQDTEHLHDVQLLNPQTPSMPIEQIPNVENISTQATTAIPVFGRAAQKITMPSMQHEANQPQVAPHSLSHATTPSYAGVEVLPQGHMRPMPTKHFPMRGKLPNVELLGNPPPSAPAYNNAELAEMADLVTIQLKHFGIEVNVVHIEPGPVITRFELDLAPGIKVAQINNLAKDLARGLSVTSVRVVEVIPGKPYVGLEIPNRKREIVYFKSGLESEEYKTSTHPMTLILGKDIAGKTIVANLAKMPHLLVAGTTGSGKSVGVNAMLLSLLFKAHANEVKLILIDPKMLELSIYEGIPHLLAPVVTDMKESANALRWCVAEMERRYLLMSQLKVRNIEGFNRTVNQAIAQNTPILDPLWQPDSKVSDQTRPILQPLPFIVVVVDEFADMMMIVGKKVEELIARLAQKARASGIHLILATQRPSVDVITGLIKANIPTRIAFQVSSKIDSRTILDQQGAEALLGHGDMLYLPPGSGLPIRVHGAFVDDHEVNKVVEFLKLTGEPQYIEDILEESAEPIAGLPPEIAGGTSDNSDALYDEAVRIVIESNRPSISFVQRKLRIGYQRAARLIEEMEEAGIVSAPQHNGNREVLVPTNAD